MLLKFSIFLMLLAISKSSSYNVKQEQLSLDAAIETADQNLVPKIRQKRNIFWDFFQKIVETKNLISDQYTDTKETLSQVYNLFNNDFSDPAPDKPTSRPPTTTVKAKIDGGDSNDSETSTTTEPYRISRYEFGRILGRNYRGLKRLQDIEFQDALNQTKYNIQEYKQEAQKQFANSKVVDLKNQIKG